MYNKKFDWAEATLLLDFVFTERNLGEGAGRVVEHSFSYSIFFFNVNQTTVMILYL